MLNRLSFLGAVIGLTCAYGSAAGNFPSDFQEAVRLLRTPGKEADAEAAFLELAARKIRHSRGTDAALEMASLCALRRKGFEEAEQMKQTIWMVPVVGLLTLCGCSVQPLGGHNGVDVMIDSEPIDNTIMPADRRAHRLMVRSGLVG